MTEVLTAIAVLAVMVPIAFFSYQFIKLIMTGPHTGGPNRNNRDD
jgi:hypothetical protein